MILNKTLPRLIISFLLISPLPLGILAWLYLTAFEKTMTTTVLTNLSAIADKKTDQVNNYLNERIQNIQLLAKTYNTSVIFKVFPKFSSQPSGFQMRAYLKEEQKYRFFFHSFIEHTGYYDLLLIDIHGNVIFSIKHESDLGSNLFTNSDKKNALARADKEAITLLDTQTVLIPDYKPSNKPAIFLVTPIFEKNKVIGTVALQLDTKKLTEVFTDNTGLGLTGETPISMREKNNVLFIGPLNSIENAAFHYRLTYSKLPPPMFAAVHGKYGMGISHDYNNKEIIAAWRYIPALRLGMVVKMDTDEAFAPILRLKVSTQWALAILLLGSCLLALFLTKDLISQIQYLANYTCKIAEGNLSLRVPINGWEEFKELGKSFNNMADQINEHKNTLEKKVEERTFELKQIKEQYDDLTDRIPVGVYRYRFTTPSTNQSSKSVNGYFEFVSSQFCRILHISTQQILNDPSIAFNMAHPEDIAGLIALNNESAQSLKPFQWEGRYIIQNTIHWIRLESIPTPLPNGESLWNGIMTDITERKNFEAELVKAKIRAESADQAKGDFLANISHEIRTPMNAIIGLTQLVLESDLNSQQADFLQTILSSSKSLMKLLNDILDYAKIESGRLDIEHIPISLNQILHDMEDLFAAKLKKKNLELCCQIQPDVPSEFIGDPLRLSQILNNLVGNAIKFTNRGKIIINVQLVSQQNEDLNIQFDVSDTGIGLSELQIKNLFQAFSQADSSITRKYGGSGLGLAICYKLVNLMGGEISVKSKVACGTTFTFNIKAKSVASEKLLLNQDLASAQIKNNETVLLLSTDKNKTPLSQIPKSNQFKDVHILLVEDNTINQLVANQYLNRMGAIITIANNGKEAVELVEKQKFDVILMDLQMPIMDGFEATQKIRKLESAKKIPILAMTAAVMQQDRDRCEKLGMLDFISKPIDPKYLYEALEKSLNKV